MELIKEQGAEPLCSGHGKSGGATAEGQRELLAGFGITEEMGVPIKSSMETVRISVTPEGLPVHMDRTRTLPTVLSHWGGLSRMRIFGARSKADDEQLSDRMQYGANLCHSLGMENMSKK